MLKVLVTGSCGFIGANLVVMLRAEGHEITILDNFTRGSIDHLDDPKAYTVVNAHIRDEDTVAKVALGNDAIIHLAAYGSVVESVAKRKGEVERNFAAYNLAARELGFHPTVAIEEAMALTWKWFQQYNINPGLWALI